jgi:hypothetical protein
MNSRCVFSHTSEMLCHVQHGKWVHGGFSERRVKASQANELLAFRDEAEARALESSLELQLQDGQTGHYANALPALAGDDPV